MNLDVWRAKSELLLQDSVECICEKPSLPIHCYEGRRDEALKLDQT
jgi:hypothetical protein